MQRRNSKKQLEKRLSALQDLSVKLMEASSHPRDLLELLVNKAVELFQCDAGTLYLKHDEKNLIFEVAVNRTVGVGDFSRSLVPIEGKGLAAYVFRSGKPLRVKDVHQLPARAPYAFDDSFDRRLGYRTRSTLVQPLMSSKGEVLGVLQLINRKNHPSDAWPLDSDAALRKMPAFSTDDGRLLGSFAAVASASIETSQLHRNIEQLFEGFVKASVHAIESRDAATRGHSDRVAILTVELAKRVDASDDRDLRGIHFTPAQMAEIRYAALLHDFGKIGVSEATLQKEEKLSREQKIEIRARFNEFRNSAEVRVLREYIHDLLKRNAAPNEVELAAVNRRIQEFSRAIEGHWSLILDLSKPTVLDEDRSHKLHELKHLKCHDCEGHLQPLLKPEESKALSILRGSLAEDERIEIEEHVTHSFEFLRKIPWTRELAGVPEIAYAHHERLDGSGYPRKVRADEIPVQAKIMAVTDVFDALTANDRPYKPALPVERALAIIEMECKAGRLDPKFFRAFVEGRVFDCAEIRRFNEDFGKKAA